MIGRARMPNAQELIPAVTPSDDMTRLLLIDASSGYPLKRTKAGFRKTKTWNDATDVCVFYWSPDFDKGTLKTNGYIADSAALARLSTSKFPDGSDDGIDTVICPIDDTKRRIARVELCDPA